MQLQVVTISVSSLRNSRRFYQEILGFEPDISYEATRWQSYRLEGGGGFGIAEVPDLVRCDSADIVNFSVEDVRALWERVRERVPVEAPLSTTPWGTHKFVIRDPDGFRLGFVERSSD
ncbi:MAG: VOC family protein [Bacillota bacterium]